MPVFLVSINEWSREGNGQTPELFGIVTTLDSAADAVAWTLDGEAIEPRDIDVEQVSARNDCWLALGPEEDQ